MRHRCLQYHYFYMLSAFKAIKIYSSHIFTYLKNIYNNFLSVINHWAVCFRNLRLENNLKHKIDLGSQELEYIQREIEAWEEDTPHYINSLCSRMLCPGLWSENSDKALFARLSVADWQAASCATFGIEL